MKKRLESFRYAFRGIYIAINQPNMVIHLFSAIVVILAGMLFDISEIDWVLVILAISLVLVTETINTSIEKLTDLVSPDHNEIAGQVKDIAAGAVLISAIAAVVIGLIVFVPEFKTLFTQYV